MQGPEDRPGNIRSNNRLAHPKEGTIFRRRRGSRTKTGDLVQGDCLGIKIEHRILLAVSEARDLIHVYRFR